MYRERHNIQQFIAAEPSLVLVEVKSVHGSTPRDEGAWMLVGGSQIFRTIGGGQLENIAIEKAREILAIDDCVDCEMQVPLGPEIGQCCGGSVNLHISRLDEVGLQAIKNRNQTELANLPHVYIFGAGHVGNALAEALLLLPVNPVLVDTRKAELQHAPSGIETKLTAIPESEVSKAPANSAFIILTHDHALDFLIASEALSRGDAAYVGMIGSKTKRASFRNWLKREKGSDIGVERLICPIGNSHEIGDKRPEIIAAMTAAEIMAHLSQARLDSKDSMSYTVRSALQDSGVLEIQ